MSHLQRSIAVVAALSACKLAACDLAIGLDDIRVSAGTSASSSGGAGGGGQGGADAGQMGECEPMTMEACYGGPNGTIDVGECKGGTRTCGEDGFWGPCEGEVVPQIENCASGKDEDCNTTIGCTGALAWFKTYLNVSDTIGRAVAVGNDDGVLVAGELSGELTVGVTKLTSAGLKDAFAIHFDAGGNVRWAKVFGSAQGIESVTAAAGVSNDFVIVGAFTGSFTVDNKQVNLVDGHDSFVMRLDGKSGVVEWAVTLAGQDLAQSQGQFVNAVTSDGAGDVLVAGHFFKELSVGNQVLTTPAANAQDLFVIKLTGGTGAPIWASQISGGADFDQVSAAGVAVDHNNDVIVAGGTKQAYTPNDVLLFNKDATKSFPYATASSSSSVVVAKVSDTGEFMWGKSAGGVGNEVGIAASGVAVGPSGDVVIVGRVDGKLSFDPSHEINVVPLTSTGFLATLDALGAAKTVTRLGDSLTSAASAVAVDPLGNIVVGGVHRGAIIVGSFSMPGTQDSLDNGFLIKFDPSHTVLWGKSLGGPSADLLNAVAADRYGQAIATGAFISSISFDGMAPVTNPNFPFYELFVVKYQP